MCGIKLHNELDTIWFLVNLICGIVAVDGKYNLMLYIKEECEGIIQEYAQLVRGAGGVLNNEGFGNNKLVDDMAEKTAKAILQEMHGKDFSEYGFRDACIKTEIQLQNVDKDRSYERGVRIR